MTDAPTVEGIRNAAQRIEPHIHRTPVMTCSALDEMAGARLFFKCENLQRTGSFKIRGASNAILSLADDAAARGVVTHSSGNHAAAVACTARTRGIPAWIVMPSNAPRTKRIAVEGYGGKVTECAPTLESRELEMRRFREETGATLIHPYNDPRIIAGQGTAALELLEDVPDLDAVIAPASGGGLLSGTSIAAKGHSPTVRVFGAEPRNADDAFRSLASGRLEPAADAYTIADGLRATLCELTFGILKQNVEQIALVSEDEIIWAMRLVWERMKIIIEPSSAVPVAAMLLHRVPEEGLRAGVILSGGNLDLDHLPF
jgi:threonine dehydratase/serine racemase